MRKKDCFGFGVEPQFAQNHFFVVLPPAREKSRPVQIYERYRWTSKEEAEAAAASGKIVYADGQFLTDGDILRLEISRYKWNLVRKELTAAFNARLRAERKPVGKFETGGVPVWRVFGKEMMTLLWGIEDCDPSNIPTALRNWNGLLPEERWWLYTMTNAATGQLGDKRGWRTALRYALCENPVIEERHIQQSLWNEDKA